MKRLVTQFDNGRVNASVATPTCSSSCCCCCCLATIIGSSTMLHNKVKYEARKNGLPTNSVRFYSALAALYVPVTVALYAMFNYAINLLTRDCTTRSYGGYTYETCSTPAFVVSSSLLAFVLFIVLAYLYVSVKVKLPLIRALVVTTLISIAFLIEVSIGIAAIFTTAGIGYFVFVALVTTPVIAFHTRHYIYKNNILKQNNIEKARGNVGGTETDFSYEKLKKNDQDSNLPPAH